MPSMMKLYSSTSLLQMVYREIVSRVDLGIDTSRLETKGFGESNPVSDNTSPEGKANNRRVEFVKI